MSLDASRRVSTDAVLLKTIIDQFVEREIHPAGDLKAFEELALGLIDRIDPAVATDILQPLHAHPDTPRRVRARLREVGAGVGALAKAQGSEATGRPPPIKDMNALDANRLRELAADLSLDFDLSMRQSLARAARDDLTLARILLDRDDLDLDPAAFFLPPRVLNDRRLCSTPAVRRSSMAAARLCRLIGRWLWVSKKRP